MSKEQQILFHTLLFTAKYIEIKCVFNPFKITLLIKSLN